MEEYLEVLTELGEPTRKMKLRTEVHKSGDWHRTVQIWIINDNNHLLLQKRHSKKIGSPGKWDISCGGHCVNGETSIQSAKRELEEELGLIMSDDKFEYLYTIKYISQQGLNNEFVDTYLIKYNFDIGNIKFQEDEIEALKSVHYKELQKLYYDTESDIARRDIAFKRLFEILDKRCKA